MRNLLISSFALSTIAFSAFSQTIMEVGKQKVSKDEFVQMYERNSIKGKVDYSEPAVRDYISYYVLYRMKLQEAKELRLDTVSSVKKEMEMYKQQLAQSYLKDKSITEKLAKEAYERMQHEIEVAHIFDPFPMNGDVPEAAKYIKGYYDEIKKGQMSFEEAAKKYSKDLSSAKNGGYLGYITALQADYKFEDKFYNTPVGTISEPFKSTIGWHIVKVINKRPNQGQVQIQQILISALPSATPEKRKEAETKVAELQSALKNGESFDELVAKFSDDKFSKSKNGVLAPFRSGDVAKELEIAAFGLKNAGDIAGPIKTEFGYHFIKLVKKIPLGTYEEMQDELLRKLDVDDRTLAANNAREEAVRKSYKYIQQQQQLDALKNLAKTNNEIFTKDPDNQLDHKAQLFQIDGKKFTIGDFVSYVNSVNKGRPLMKNNTDKMIDDLYNGYVNKNINEIRLSKLETENSEYRRLLNDYNDAILIFDLTSNKIWKRANDDTLGLNDFYQKNQAKYYWEPGFRGQIYQSKNKASLEALVKKINQGVSPNKAYEELIMHPSEPAPITTQSGRYISKKYGFNTSALKVDTPSTITEDNGTYTLAIPSEIFTTNTPKTLEEAKGYIVSDYQEYLETEWKASMQKKYPVKINESVLKTVFKK